MGELYQGKFTKTHLSQLITLTLVKRCNILKNLSEISGVSARFLRKEVIVYQQGQFTNKLAYRETMENNKKRDR